MKNIHLVETNSKSRLVLRDIDKKLILHTPITQWHGKNLNIYVTSEDDIREKDWCLYNKNHNSKNPSWEVVKCSKIERKEMHPVSEGRLLLWMKKIILTDNEELIKDGVQAVPEEFLEWFVNNQSCELVEVKKNYLSNDGKWKDVLLPSEWEVDTKVNYKIVIPKEEQTQLHSSNGDIVPDYSQPKSHLESTLEGLDKVETLEEIKPPIGKFIIENATPTKGADGDYYHYSEVCKLLKLLYSEDDIALAFNEGQALGVRGKLIDGKEWVRTHKKEWFEQFKKN